jgi:hypothetical protein
MRIQAEPKVLLYRRTEVRLVEGEGTDPSPLKNEFKPFIRSWGNNGDNMGTMKIVYSIPIIGNFLKKETIPTFRTPADAEDWFRYNYEENKQLQRMFGKDNYYVALQKFKHSEYYPLSPGYLERNTTLAQTGTTWIL